MGILIFDPTRQNVWACQNISFVGNKNFFFFDNDYSDFS